MSQGRVLNLWKTKAHALEVDPSVCTVGCHDCRIHFHLLLAVAIARLSVPLILVFAFLAGFGIQLEWQVLKREGGAAVRIRGADLLERALQAASRQICPVLLGEPSLIPVPRMAAKRCLPWTYRIEREIDGRVVCHCERQVDPSCLGCGPVQRYPRKLVYKREISRTRRCDV